MGETAVKILLCCGVLRTGKAMGQVYQCWWRACREANGFSRIEYHMFYVLYPSVTYLQTLHGIIDKEINITIQNNYKSYQIVGGTLCNTEILKQSKLNL
jgi:hypothetical protein